MSWAAGAVDPDSREFVTSELRFLTREECNLHRFALAKSVKAPPSMFDVRRSDDPVNAAVWPRMREHEKASGE